MSRIDVKNGNGFYFVDVYMEEKEVGDVEKHIGEGYGDTHGPDGTFRISKLTGNITQIYTEHTVRQKSLFYLYILILAKKLGQKHLTTTDPGFIHFLQWKCKIYHHGLLENPVWIDMDKVDLEHGETDSDEIKIVMV